MDRDVLQSKAKACEERDTVACRLRTAADDETRRRLRNSGLFKGRACGLHRTLRLMRCNAFKARPRRRGKTKDDGERSIIADIEPVNATDSSEPARPGPGFPGRSTKPEVAGQFHIHLDCRGLAVWRASPWSLGPVAFPRLDSGPVFPPRGRLVHEGRSRCVTGHGCSDDGRLAPRKS